MVDNPCIFCADEHRYDCVKTNWCNIYKEDVIICSNCDSVCYKKDLIYENCDDYDDLLCPYCHESVLKEYNVELTGTITVYALDEESAHDIARKEMADDMIEMNVTYCKER
jgi:hypothetical protein